MTEKTDERYVANSARSWGRAYSRYDAVANWAVNDGTPSGETTKVDVGKVTGPVSMGPGVIKPASDETEIDVTTYEIEGDDLQRVRELAGELEIAVEEAMVNATEVDTDE